MRRTLPVLLALVVILSGGVVHGLWTDRWMVSAAAAAVPGLLEQVPAIIGEWDGQPLEGDSRPSREAFGHLVRRYVHRRTGEAITVALVAGRPGPISIHTPDACYPASGYEMMHPQKHEAPALAEGPRGDFRTARFIRRRAAEETKLRIFWAWSADGSWKAPENPRMAFAGSSVLYKLYLIRELPTRETTLTDDPGNDLMRVLLPELQRALFTTS